MSALERPSGLWAAPPPAAAVEIAASHVAAAAVELRGGRPVIAAHAAAALPPGALVPSLTAANAVDRPAVAEALDRVLDRIGRPKRIGLIVPDQVVKVSLVRFEQLPARAQDLDQLVRWQVRKAAPFPLEEAQVGYVPGERTAAGQELIVTLARQEVVREYEALCAAAGAHAGLVDIAMFNVINAALAAGPVPAGDWLLVSAAGESASIAIMRGEALIFFRSRGADAEGTLADLVHQTAMYYEDRLEGRGFSRVLLAGVSAAGDPAAVDALRRGLRERLGLDVEPVNALAAASVTDRITVGSTMADTLTPLVGMLLRDREAAA